jgi:hypothetical protein
MYCISPMNTLVLLARFAGSVIPVATAASF